MNWEELATGFVVDCLGPVDPEVLVLTVEDGSAPAAGLVNYAQHPADPGLRELALSADYIGYLDEALRKIVREDFTTAVLPTGVCANVNHINYGRSGEPAAGYPIGAAGGLCAGGGGGAGDAGRVPVEGDTIRVSRELVELERFQVPDGLYAEAKRFLATGKQNRPAGMDGLDFKNGAPLWCGCANGRRRRTGRR